MAENENKQENVVVEDFKRTNAKKSKKKFRHRQQNPVLAFYEDNKQYLLLFGVIVVALAAILVSILALKIPVVPVCLIIVLEAGIAVCLHDVPIWLHGLVVLVQIIAGAICGWSCACPLYNAAKIWYTIYTTLHKNSKEVNP